ncbi:metabolite-proton symporter [Saccharopolyspora antimicrobica]|uniref:Putative proline/betaine transporter n=1 Tax=Saccharopolyspora antimicrobica TaxID=455193 RepID=A0A1I5E6Z2_9PSEU|nr:MFS transporter [Saccharopolyspora antimicrobica]RKT86694.1 metabolite-proton symporter [Saccharopolyspora antimicrobica]SFO07227.1 metabolite-proton symporter [Saccharopolyspora antimicrobica]
MPHTIRARQPSSSSMARKVIAASFIGTTVEWYDFFLYGTASALVFNRLFFPQFSSLAGTIAAFGAFAAGFIARPVGGVLFGHFGDRVGRKSMLIYSLVGMGASTVAIGLLPTYAQIGVLAPILLVLCRLVQGFAVGGEWGGAVLMSVEHSPAHKRGLAGSWTQAGSPAGLVLATAAFGGFSMLPDDAFLSWGWRVPFLLSAALVVVGMFIRLNVIESPEFQEVKRAGARTRLPIVDAVRNHPLNILLAVGCCLAPFVNFYLVATFVLTYGTSSLGLERSAVLVVVAIAAVLEVVTIPLAAALSDRIGQRKVFLTGAALFAAFAYPFFLINESAVSTWVLGITCVVGLSLIHPLMYGPMATLFAEMFAPEVRYSAASLGYQLGAIFGGGFAPLVLTALLATGGGSATALPPYLIIVSVLTFASVHFATRPGRAHSNPGEDR